MSTQKKKGKPLLHSCNGIQRVISPTDCVMSCQRLPSSLFLGGGLYRIQNTFALLGRWLVWNIEYIRYSWEVAYMEYRKHSLFLGGGLYGIQNTFTLLGRWLVWSTENIHSSWEVACMEYRIHSLLLGGDLYEIQNTFTLLGGWLV